MFVFPERPADLSAQTDAQLDALIDACRTSIEAASDGEITPDVLAGIRSTNDLFCACRDEKASRVDATEGARTELEDILKNVGLGGDPEPDPEPDPAPEGETDENGDPIVIVHEEEASDKVPTFRLNKKTPSLGDIEKNAPTQPKKVGVKPSKMMAACQVAGKVPGEAFEDMREVAIAMAERWKAVANSNTGERFSVATMLANFDEDSILTEEAGLNLDKLGYFEVGEGGIGDLQAAICAPREPIYDLGCPSSTRRPVWNSLRKYRAPRGGVQIYPSPKLSDVRDANGVSFNDVTGFAGTGLWSRADDANPAAVKNACAVIPCNDVVNYDIYGIYRCMTIKNMNAMTFPELVEAFLNRLGALHARLGEVTLLNAMKASVNVYDAVTNVPYGASIGVLETLLRTVSFYKEQERYDDVSFQMWAPRQFRDMLIADQILQRNTTGRVSMSDRIHAASEVDSALSELGISATWTLDRATGWPTVDFMTDGGVVPRWPVVMNAFLTPVGNMRALDGGRMDIGVAPGNLYRDNVSNSKNEFTFFWESYEGIVDFGCRSLHMRFQDVCVGGAQPTDCALICDGALS